MRRQVLSILLFVLVFGISGNLFAEHQFDARGEIRLMPSKVFVYDNGDVSVEMNNFEIMLDQQEDGSYEMPSFGNLYDTKFFVHGDDADYIHVETKSQGYGGVMSEEMRRVHFPTVRDFPRGVDLTDRKLFVFTSYSSVVFLSKAPVVDLNDLVFIWNGANIYAEYKGQPLFLRMTFSFDENSIQLKVSRPRYELTDFGSNLRLVNFSVRRSVGNDNGRVRLLHADSVLLEDGGMTGSSDIPLCRLGDFDPDQKNQAFVFCEDDTLPEYAKKP